MTEQLLNSSTLSNFGLLLDVLGAFFLSKGIISRFGPQIIRETDDLWDGNPLRLKSAAIQFVEGWAGFTLLFLGFALQYIANLNSASAAVDRLWLIEIVSALAVLVLVYKIVDFLAVKRSRRLVIFRWKASILRNLENPTESYMDLFEEALSLKALKGASIADRKKRIVAIVKDHEKA